MTIEERLIRSAAATQPASFARVLGGQPLQCAASTLAFLPDASFSNVVSHLAPYFTAQCLGQVLDENADLVAAVPPPVLASALRAADAPVRKRALDVLPAKRRSAVMRLLRASPDSAASLVEAAVAALPSTMTASDALSKLKAEPSPTSYVYVLGEQQSLVGVVSMADLLVAKGTSPLSDIANTEALSIDASVTWAEILAHQGWERFHMLPVVDRSGRFLGAVRLATVRKLERAAILADDSGGSTRAASDLGGLFTVGFTALVRWVFSFGGADPEERR